VCVYRTDFERGKRIHFAASQPARKRKDLVNATKLVLSPGSSSYGGQVVGTHWPSDFVLTSNAAGGQV